MLSPIYGQLSPLRIPTRAPRELSDSDALAYIAAVETADGQALEDAVKFAYEDFIVGCKSDGIWSAIKASCILAGARTLSGALVPLIGAAPTNLNFVSEDYNRKTGLLGNGATKVLNTNIAGNSSIIPQDNCHFSVHATTAPSLNTTGAYGAYGGNAGSSFAGIIMFRGTSNGFASNANGSTRPNITISDFSGFKAVSRSTSSAWTARTNGSNTLFSVASRTRLAANIAIFSRTVAANLPSNGRYSFYSLGESLDLAKLDSRVSTLMTAIATAIP